jgi:hypothetical protein
LKVIVGGISYRRLRIKFMSVIIITGTCKRRDAIRETKREREMQFSTDDYSSSGSCA